MGWKVGVSKEAKRFLSENAFAIEEVKTLVGKAIRHFRGESVNIDIRKLKGAWKGFYRIRRGKIRIIAEFDFANSAVFIERIDWRGGVYK